MTDSPKQPAIQSVSRAIAILRCFRSGKDLGLTEISKMVGLHKSTTAGIVNTLRMERFLEQNPHTGKLRLGLDLFCLAVNAKLELGEICGPYLDELLESTGETVNLAVRSGDQVVYVAKKESPHSMRISTNVGKHMPLYCTAIGKAILAFTQEGEARPLIDNIVFKAFTDRTIVSRERLAEELVRIRREGVAYDFEELEYGLICIAAPISESPGKPLGAISVSGPSMRMGAETRADIARQLLTLSGKISEELSRVYIP